MKIKFQNDNGKAMEMKVKAGHVDKMLISAARHLEAGFEVRSTRNPCLINMKTKERIQLHRKGGGGSS